MPGRRTLNGLLFATLAVLMSMEPASADGLAGMLHPALGIPVTLGIAALEAVILARVITGVPHPWRESLLANLISAFAGWVFMVWVGLSQPSLIPGWDLLSRGWQDATVFAMAFTMTLAIELTYLWLRWRSFGAKRVALAAFLANVASYALLIPLAYLLDQMTMLM